MRVKHTQFRKLSLSCNFRCYPKKKLLENAFPVQKTKIKKKPWTLQILPYLRYTCSMYEEDSWRYTMYDSPQDKQAYRHQTWITWLVAHHKSAYAIHRSTCTWIVGATVVLHTGNLWFVRPIDCNVYHCIFQSINFQYTQHRMFKHTWKSTVGG